MKKGLLAIFLFALLLNFAWAQNPRDPVPAETTETTTPTDPAADPTADQPADTGTTKTTVTLFKSSTAHYDVYSAVSEQHAQSTAAMLEALMTVYNSFFHFNTDTLSAKLRVRIYDSKTDFDVYLKKVISQTREDFVHLQYSTLEKSELVGYVQGNATYEQALRHQSVIQFLKAFIPYPPLWLREGFAIFFEDIIYNEKTQTASFRENRVWLDTLKAIKKGTDGRKMIAMKNFLSMGNDQLTSQLNTFFPQAWGFVSFLNYSENKLYNRILWDSIFLLSPEKTQTENEAIINQKVLAWVNIDDLEKDYLSFIDSMMTFNDYVERGIQLYTEKKYDDGLKTFTSAVKLKPDEFISWYYLGLISYSKGNYLTAEENYLKALELGADKAPTFYALGANAYTDKRSDEAVEYLTQAKAEGDLDYSSKCDELIARIAEEAEETL